jgi:parallel beta-helix repeat protein
MGTGGTVGVSADPFSRIQRPELEVAGVGAVEHGFRVHGDRSVIRYFSIHHFGTDYTEGILVIDGASDVVILGNVIGLAPDVFQAPDEGEISLAFCIYAVDAGSVTIEGNIVAYCAFSGITSTNQCAGWQISGNEVRGNGFGDSAKDGLDLVECAGGVDIAGNLIAGNYGCGLDTWQSEGGHSVAGNTIDGNGLGEQDLAGVRLFGTGSSLSGNVIHANAGPGIAIVGVSTGVNFTPALQNRISMNHFDGNGGPAVDMLAGGISTGGDGITANSGGLVDRCGYNAAYGNAGLDFPVLSEAVLNSTGTMLDVSGSACPSSTVELYRAQPGAGDSLGPQSYGEGVEFLGEVSTGDSSSFSGSLSVRLNTGDRVTAIAIDAEGNTSEFCANVIVER